MKVRHIIISLIFGAWAFATVSCGPRSNDAMERTFRENQGDFEQLRQLIMEDSSVANVRSVWKDSTDPEMEAFNRGLSKTRLDQYRRLLRRLHLRGVLGGEGGVTFKPYYDRFQDKGYLYSEGVPPGIATKPHDLNEPKYSVKRLQEHWYLYEWTAYTWITDDLVAWRRGYGLIANAAPI